MLRAEAVVLRDWRDTDAPTLEPVCGYEGVSLFTSVPVRYSLEAARQWVERQRQKRASGSAIVLAVTKSDEDTALGMVALSSTPHSSSDAELGYWLVPAARGTGLALPAARLVATWGFNELRLARIKLSIEPDNSASLRIAERLGASRVGSTNREAGGRHWPMEVYELTPG